MKNLTELIEATATDILNQWTSEATGDLDEYISSKLEALEDTEPQVSQTIGQMYLRRLMAAA